MPTVQAPAPKPRAVAGGRAVALYGICGPELAGRKLTVDGRRVQAVAHGRIALLIASVDRADAEEAELARRRVDPACRAAEAQTHERTIARASAHGAVMPVPMLTIFADLATLTAHADANGDRWARALARVGARCEHVVHLYAGPHRSPFDAEPYVLRVAERSARTRREPPVEGDGPAAVHARAVWTDVAALAGTLRRVATDGRRGALFAAVALLDEPGGRELAAVLERHALAGAGLGVTTYLEGPRAPFSFA